LKLFLYLKIAADSHAALSSGLSEPDWHLTAEISKEIRNPRKSEPDWQNKNECSVTLLPALKFRRCPHSVTATPSQLYLLCRSTHSLHSCFPKIFLISDFFHPVGALVVEISGYSLIEPANRDILEL